MTLISVIQDKKIWTMKKSLKFEKDEQQKKEIKTVWNEIKVN